MKDFVFVSGNKQKVEMLEMLLEQKVEHYDLDLDEIQSLDLGEVTEKKARQAYKVLKKPVLVDDVGVTINAMKDLPGPFIKFFLKSLSREGICRLADNYDDRSAEATTYFVYFDGKVAHHISGTVHGSISSKPRGDTNTLAGMGWNSIFIPQGQEKTLAEMGDGNFELYTPRAVAVKKLKEFLK